MPDEPYCELCDLPLAFCSHGRPAPVRQDPPAPVTRSASGRATAPRTAPRTSPAPRATTPTQSARVEAAAPRVVTVPGLLAVSPDQVAHFPGCPTEAGTDFAGWGLIMRASELAWQELGNGQPVPCDAGNAPELIATRQCDTCVAHGSAWL